MRQIHLSLIAVGAVAAWLPAQDVERSPFLRGAIALGRGVWLRHWPNDANTLLVAVRDGDQEARCVVQLRDVQDARRVGDDTVLLAGTDAAGHGCLEQLRLSADGLEPVGEVNLGDRRPALLAARHGTIAFLADDRVLWHARLPTPFALPGAESWQVLADRSRIGERTDHYGDAGLGITRDGYVLLRLDTASKLEFALPGAPESGAAEEPAAPPPLHFAAAARTGSPWSVAGVPISPLCAPAVVANGSPGVPVWSRLEIGAKQRSVGLRIVALVSWTRGDAPSTVALDGHRWLLPMRWIGGAEEPSRFALQQPFAALAPLPRGAAAVGAFVHVQLAVLDADGALLGATDVCTTRIAAAATER